MMTIGQRGALELIAESIASTGTSPSMDSIAASLGVSKSTVHRYVHGLVGRGYIRLDPAKHRSIALTKLGEDAVNLLAHFPTSELVAELERRKNEVFPQ